MIKLSYVALRRGVDIREAFNQINRYQRDSFWSGSGLFEYVQLFVISNGTLTKYYSNTTRSQHVGDLTGGKHPRHPRHSPERGEPHDGHLAGATRACTPRAGVEVGRPPRPRSADFRYTPLARKGTPPGRFSGG